MEFHDDLLPQKEEPSLMSTVPQTTSIESEVSAEIVAGTEKELIERLSGGSKEKYVRFVLSAMSSLPWVGVLSAVGVVSGIAGAAANLKAEHDQEVINNLFRLWLQEHSERFKELGLTLQEILGRLDTFGEQAQKRLQDPEYLALVRQAFQAWDNAETQDKRTLLKKLITNAGAVTLAEDTVVRLFIAWVDQYHESHFAVIREVHKKRGITRAEIWDNLNPTQRPPNRPRENSAQADLFRYLISDLTMGRVIRQQREVNYAGEFLKKSTKGIKRSPPSDTMESSFEDEDGYELSELGAMFVRYVLEDATPQLTEGDSSGQE